MARPGRGPSRPLGPRPGQYGSMSRCSEGWNVPQYGDTTTTAATPTWGRLRSCGRSAVLYATPRRATPRPWVLVLVRGGIVRPCVALGALDQVLGTCLGVDPAPPGCSSCMAAARLVLNLNGCSIVSYSVLVWPPWRIGPHSAWRCIACPMTPLPPARLQLGPSNPPPCRFRKGGSRKLTFDMRGGKVTIFHPHPLPIRPWF